jgi:methanogenic corrinoid protein MtbC1
MDGLKSFLLDDLLQQQQDREAQKKSQDKGINNLQVILKEFKDASKDIDEFVSKFKEDKIYVDSVLSMCEANKLSSIEVYNVYVDC